MEKNAKITIFMLLISATAYIHPMCSSTRSYSPHTGGHKPGKRGKPGNSGNLKNCENLRKTQGNLNFCGKNLENSGKMKNM